MEINGNLRNLTSPPLSSNLWTDGH